MSNTIGVATTDNMQKYENYKEQFKRLKKAFNYKFYMEAIFIEYAMMEDRLEAILRYEGNEKKPKNEKNLSVLGEKSTRLRKFRSKIKVCLKNILQMALQMRFPDGLPSEML